MIVASLVKKLLPIIFRKLIVHFPALAKLDMMLKYIEDDNELDIEVRRLREENRKGEVERAFLKDQIKDIWEVLKKGKGKK